MSDIDDGMDYDRVVKIGDVIKFEDKLYLVGDVNPHGGVCDDCHYFSPYDTSSEVIGNVFDNPELLKQLTKEVTS